MALPLRAISFASRFRPPDRTQSQQDTVAYAEAALAADKREGQLLAVRARWAALALIAVILPIMQPHRAVLYYEFLIVLSALIGWAQLKVGTVGRSRRELFLIFCDVVVLTLILIVPNPFDDKQWPATSQLHFGNFLNYFVLLAGATLAYSWRTVATLGALIVVVWCMGLAWLWFQPGDPAMTAGISAAIGGDTRLLNIIDPNSMHIQARLFEAVIMLIVAGTLALAVRRSNNLLLRHASVERERSNLARYFSPTVVQELSKNDEPLKQVRTQNVAVLFVDIVGFTAFTDGKDPEDIIRTLRQFHGLMEDQVFRNGGTLDKYLGDGLMATFGTPFAGLTDACNALRCARGMLATIGDLNRTRAQQGELPIRAGFGLHYGPVVLGDIGAHRLEFAVIGSTVNAASRLEALTRQLGCSLVASDALIDQVRSELNGSDAEFTHLARQPAQAVRGIEQPIGIWIQA